MTAASQFLDGRSIPPNQVLETDVCIIGAGPAGITLAREFIGQSFRVCVLESGGLEFDRETQSLCRGDNIGYPYYPLETARLRYFGGTTNHWGGMLRPLDPIDFQKRDWIPHSGWPFGKPELEPYYERAQPLFRVGPYRYEASDWAAVDGRKPLNLPEEQWVHPVFQMAENMSFGEAYVNELAGAPNIQILLYANAVELETDETAQTVRRVRVGTLGGSRYWVAARLFILATGGIENARLLLVSNSVSKPGLGNYHDLVGRFFADHAFIDSGILLPADAHLETSLYSSRVVRGTLLVYGLALSEVVLRQQRLHNSCCFLGVRVLGRSGAGAGVDSFREVLRAIRSGQVPPDMGRHLANILWDIDIVAKIYTQRAKKGWRVALIEVLSCLEPAPNPDSQVSLSYERDQLGVSRVQLDWRLTEADLASWKRSTEAFAQAVGAAGIGRMQILLDREELWPIPTGSAPWTGPRGGCHHMGTTRMHEDPKQGVVDPNCRVHSVSNLYIASSSVFPTYGYANPTFTIVALAIRLADHIKSVLGCKGNGH